MLVVLVAEEEDDLELITIGGVELVGVTRLITIMTLQIETSSSNV